MKRMAAMVVVGLMAACGRAPQQHAGTFALDRAGRPSTQAGAIDLNNGWWLAGSAPEDYTGNAALDASGAASGELDSTSPPGGEFGTVMTCVDATSLRGQRLALSATVGTSGVARWAGLWMRVDAESGNVTAFDNMQGRPITGDTADAQYQVVLDVGNDAADVCYGLLLVDAGRAHFAALATRVVDGSVPTTDGGLGNGWFLAGNAPDRYAPTLSFASSGAAQGTLASRDATVAADLFGTVMTSIDAAPDVGKTLRLVGNVAPTNVTGWAGLWMRIDDADGNTLAFDNMQDRPITGSAAAAPYTVELDVPAGAATISFGILLDGSGRVDFTGLALQ